MIKKSKSKGQVILEYSQVTKQRFFEKPTLHDFESAVWSLRALMEEAEVPCTLAGLWEGPTRPLESVGNSTPLFSWQ